jgi:hypothetical protein
LGKLAYDAKTEADRLVYALRRSILQLEVVLDEPDMDNADHSLKRVHNVWQSVSALYGIVNDLSV